MDWSDPNQQSETGFFPGIANRDASSSVATHPDLEPEHVRLNFSRDAKSGQDTEREVSMKPADRDYLCRGLVCFATLLFTLAGSGVCVLALYSLYSGPAQWLPGMLGSPMHTSPAPLGGLVVGGLVAVLGCLGCLGACRQSKPCLCCFGIALAVVMALTAACLGILMATQSALSDWGNNGYRLANLSAPATRTVVTLHVEFGAFVAFCAPNATVAVPLVDALDSGAAPALSARDQLHFCTEDALSLFGEWCVASRARCTLSCCAIADRTWAARSTRGCKR